MFRPPAPCNSQNEWTAGILQRLTHLALESASHLYPPLTCRHPPKAVLRRLPPVAKASNGCLKPLKGFEPCVDSWTLVLGACLTGTLAAQQPRPSTTSGTFWMSAPASTSENRHASSSTEKPSGSIDRLRAPADSVRRTSRARREPQRKRRVAGTNRRRSRPTSRCRSRSTSSSGRTNCPAGPGTCRAPRKK